MAGKDDDAWTERKEELSQMKEQNEQLPKNWELENGLIYYKNRLFIPLNEDLLSEIVKECNDCKVAGHFGQENTVELVTRNFYWENRPNGLTTTSDHLMSVNTTNPHNTRSMDFSKH